MRTVIRAIGWAVSLVLFSLLFCLFPAHASVDERTALTVLTPDGPSAMSMADYLPGAVAAEMPVLFGPEALKAQAVAARTYVLAARRHDDADVCTDSGCCLAWLDETALRAVWGGDYEANRAAVEAACRATDGQVLTYGGEAIQAAFHASSAGTTEDSGSLWSPLPYLVSVPTPETAETVPGLVTEAVFAPGELCALLGINPDGAPETWLGTLETDDAGRAAALTVGGQRFTGAALRSALGLRSTAFTVRYEDGAFRFTVAGHGHGVGMSQYGAMLLAADGWTYDEILYHYYPGTLLSDAAAASSARSTQSAPSRTSARTAAPGGSAPDSSSSASGSSTVSRTQRRSGRAP